MEFGRTGFDERPPPREAPSLRRPLQHGSALVRIGPAGPLRGAPPLVRHGPSDDLGRTGSVLPFRPELMPLRATPGPQMDCQIRVASSYGDRLPHGRQAQCAFDEQRSAAFEPEILQVYMHRAATVEV